MRRPYSGYDVLAKVSTPSFDPQTRATIADRLQAPGPPRFFDDAGFALLSAVAERIFPQDDVARPVPLAHWIDARLASDISDGYRHEHMPWQAEAWRRGLAGIEAEARRRHAIGFTGLPAKVQEAVLRAVQLGDVDAQAWRGLDPRSFFRDALLKLTAALAYAHPDLWSEIGFGGPASPRGYVRLGFDQRDPWEAKERR